MHYLWSISPNLLLATDFCCSNTIFCNILYIHMISHQMLEAQGAQSTGGKYDITLQLKSEVSQLSGQNSELRSRLGHCEGELKSALRLAERRECEV